MILYSSWLSIPLSTRIQIADKLGVRKVRSTHVSNDKVVDDGYNIKDIEIALTVENLQKITGTQTTDLTILLDEVIKSLNPIGTMEVVPPIPKPKRGRPAKVK